MDASESRKRGERPDLPEASTATPVAAAESAATTTAATTSVAAAESTAATTAATKSTATRAIFTWFSFIHT